MTQVCGKIPTLEDVGYITQLVLNVVERYGNIWKGEAGEEAAMEYSEKVLGLHEQEFDKKLHGFDGVMRDSSGKLVIIEAKATVASGISSLSATNHGREGSVEWVTYKAELMCDPTSSFYSETNAKIGEEILRVGAENVEFLVVHINPNSLNVDVSKLR